MSVTLTVTIQDNTIASNIADSVCTEYGYQPTINGVPNPMTRQEFVRAQIKQWLLDVHRRQIANTAIRTANTNVDTSINSIVIS